MAESNKPPLINTIRPQQKNVRPPKLAHNQPSALYDVFNKKETPIEITTKTTAVPTPGDILIISSNSTQTHSASNNDSRSIASDSTPTRTTLLKINHLQCDFRIIVPKSLHPDKAFSTVVNVILDQMKDVDLNVQISPWSNG